MHRPQGRSRSCLRYGCLGCLGFVGVFVAIAVIVTLIGVFSDHRGGKMQRDEQVQSLPAGSASWDRGTQDLSDIGKPLPAGAAGRVVLDLTMARFEIVPGEPGEPIRVEGRYKPEVFRLDTSMETADDGSWVYRVHFSRKGGWLKTMFADEDDDNRVRLILPREVPFTLEGRIGVGQSDADLGGLWIVETDLELGTGDHTLRFDVPLARPMRAFRLHASVGELSVRRLGNASPAEIRVNHRVGEASIDLRGAWQCDAEIELRCGIGECGVRVPDQATLELVSSGVWLGESSQSAVHRSNERQPPQAPKLRLRASAKIGELNFSD